MIEDIKGFYHQVQPSSFAKWKEFQHTKIKINEAWRAQGISRKTERTGGEWKSAAVLFVCPSQRIGWSSAAECYDWSDLDVSEDLANEDVPLASRPLLFFVTKWKLK